MKKSHLRFTMTIPLALLLCFTFSYQKQVKEGITEEEAKILLERVMELWNEGNLAIVDEFYDPEYVRHHWPRSYGTVGRDTLKAGITSLRTYFPDYNLTLDEMIVKGDKIVTLWTATGTNTGPFADLPPTGKKVRIPGVYIYRVDEGKIVEEWVIFNALHFYQQLGFTLTPPSTPEKK